MRRVFSRSSLIALLAILFPGCCYDPFLRSKLFNELDDIVDNYQGLQLTTRGCYSLPIESQRTVCYQGIGSQAVLLAAAASDFKYAYLICDNAGMVNAASRMAAIVGPQILTMGNLSTVLDRMGMNVQGSGTPDPATTVVLGAGATIQVQVAPGAPVLGPMALSGTFTVNLTPTGTFLNGPVTALAIAATWTGPAWRIDLQPSSRNFCSLTPAVAGVRRGDLTAAVRISSGNLSFPLLLRLPVQVAADLTNWDLSTTGMVSAAPFFPIAQQSNVRLRPGCPGANGVVPALNVLGIPRVGDPLTLTLSQARPSSAAVLCVGESSTSWFGFPLPFDIGPIGAPGCFLRVSLAMLVGLPTSSAGDAQIVLPIPSDPSLTGAPAFHQWLVLDPANPLGLVTSDGIRTDFYAR